MSELTEPRLTLLNQTEQAEYYGLPRFHAADRPLFFALNEAEYHAMQQCGQRKTQIFFVLQLGFFRAKQRFFKFNLKSVKKEVAYILKTYFNASPKTLPSGELHRTTRNEQRQIILDLCEYKLWKSAEHKPMALEKLTTLLRRHPKSHDTFREFIQCLEQERLTLPSYRTVQDLFTAALTHERQRLDTHLATLTNKEQTALTHLISNDDGLSRLNLIRCDQPDFRYHSMKQELEKIGLIAELYPFSQRFIPVLGLSRNAVRYYASLAEQYPAARLRKLSKTQQSLYVLCFVYHRYQEFMDNLIISFLYYVKDLNERATKAANDAEMAHLREIGLDMPDLVQFLQWYSNAKPDEWTSSQAFHQAGFSVLAKEKQKKLAEFLAGQSFDKTAEKWAYYQKKSQYIALYLRPILLTVPFDFHNPNAILMQLLTAIKTHYEKSHAIPKKLVAAMPEGLLEKLPPSIQPYLLTVSVKKEAANDEGATDDADEVIQPIDPARLEFFLYDKMARNIDYGRMFCHDSVSFADLEDDLVDDSWVDNMENLVKETGYTKLLDYCGSRLDDLADELNDAWIRTNQRIAENENTGLTITTDQQGETHWTLSDDGDENKASDFFNGLELRDIADAIKDMGDRITIWPTFQHKLFRYIKQKSVVPMLFIAGLLAEALGFGSEKMAKQSNIDLTALRTIHDDYLYVENLVDGNTVLSDYTDQLPVSRSWDLYENKRVADGDGQKFVTKFHTLQSRFSAKYYRTRRGVSIYTILANHIPINARVIGPHEHESHFMFDLLYNNETNIPIDFITGDNHSINQMNYVATDIIDTQFIPNIKKIRSETDKLYCVGDPKDYAGFLTPCDSADLDLIRSEKRGILRVLLSLILQENSQAVIIRKLSSHKRHSRLQKALWEYNKLFKSLHVLNMVDGALLRKVVKTARNRTESYHQLQRELRKVASGLFKGRRVVDNQMNCQATRLVANFIIAYNATILNEVYLRLIKRYGEETAQAIIASISPVAWQHLLFAGRYRFRKEGDHVDLDKIVDRLESELVKAL